MPDEVSYLDGVSAREHILVSTLHPSALLLDGENTHIIWDFKDMVIEKEFDSASGVGLLSNKKYPDARVVVHDAGLYRRIAERLPRPHAFLIPFTVKSLAALLVISILFTGGGFLLIRHEAKILAPRLPQKIQNHLVDIIAEGMREATPTACRTRQKAALHKMAGRMARENGLKDVRVLIDPDPQINAFALPANTLVFNAGLLKEVKNEDELAGIFAHEIGHLRKFHPQQKFINSIGISMLAAMTIGTTDMGSLSKIAVMFDDISYSKAMENEADDEAIRIMEKSGINPKAVAAFLLRIGEKEEGMTGRKWGLGEYLSTHPSTASRVEKFAAMKRKGRTPFLTKKEWAALKQDCDP